MEMLIKAPKNIECNAKQWPAKYAALGTGGVRLVRIESRSSIDVIIVKIATDSVLGPQENYYISSPNFGIAIPGVPSLLESHWIMEQLLKHDMSAPDAITVANILQDMGDF